MNCPNCGTHNLEGAKFCMECGTTLNSGCPNCGFQNLPGAKFCSNCGTSFTGATSAQARADVPPATPVNAAPEAERRLVSVLFADLVGFTTFAEGRDSEDVRETLTRYFDLARDVIGRHGGTVEKFIGDAVMAVWGAPTAYEDDAERAVRAALELVESVQSLGSGIQARAGVLTGEAAVTLGATNQGMVAGDIVNTASRLQSVAPPGTVLVGESTHRAASKAIAYEAAGEQLLKGKEAPVPAWRALRVVAEVGGRNRTEALEAPFVGRSEEMRLLKDLLHTTEREKRLRVISVIGPGGIGKSRLAWELLKYIDGLIDAIFWHSGRSPAYGEGISFWALGEMVRERAGLAERDDEQTTRAKVAEMVEQWIPDAAERTWIQSALLTLLGVESGMAGEQLFAAWRTFFERLSSNSPVMLVFEDMHYADTGLLDFVDHLLEWSRGYPIYVVTLARPDLIERRPDWGAGKRNFVSMYLEPLSEADMRQLLAGLVPGLPDAAVSRIVARADGIPLYAVETVRTLLGEGKLVEEDGKYVPKGDLTQLAVPETLTALIAARLDTLDETDRRIVHDAAVIGQSFTLAAVAAVADMPEAELEPRLASLVRRELLQRQMDARSPERGQYAFVQALIREVAYNTLAKKDRKRLHLAAARYFESLGNDEIAGALASHYLAAYSNAGEDAEADALANQARIALKAAAARSVALGSFAQASKFLQEALTVTTDPKEQQSLLEQAADAADTAGKFDDAERLLREAIAKSQAIGDRNGEARTTGRLGYIMGTYYRNDEAIALLEPALERLKDIDDELDLAWLKLFTAASRSRARRFQDAAPLYEEVLAVAEQRGELVLLTRALLSKGSMLSNVGRRREAIGVTRAARALAAEQGLTEYELRGRMTEAIQESEFNVGRAYQLLSDGIELARLRGHRGSLNVLIGNIGYTGFLAGKWDEVIPLVDATALDESVSTADLANILNNAIIIHAARGDDASDALARLRDAASELGDAGSVEVTGDPFANVALANGDLETAFDQFSRIYQASPAYIQEYSYRAALVKIWAGDAAGVSVPLQANEAMGGSGQLHAARAATLAAGVAALEGRTTEAMPLFREALANWRASGSVWDEVLTGITMAQLLDPSEPEVAAVIASTHEILERLRAKPYLERLDAAVAAKAPAPRAAAARTPVQAEVPTA